MTLSIAMSSRILRGHISCVLAHKVGMQPIYICPGNTFPGKVIAVYWSNGPPGMLPWWRHQMKPFSALLPICAGNSSATGEFPHKGQWRGALMFSLICAWIYNGWVNNHEAGDLRRHRAHFDVTVMPYSFSDNLGNSLCSLKSSTEKSVLILSLISLYRESVYVWWQFTEQYVCMKKIVWL